ncbi:MAG: ABC transporter ATP-binding protein [Planctomycetes bacterium]|nr:ABC transporter ATP-binding protein [Planctomycetota bacterium]
MPYISTVDLVKEYRMGAQQVRAVDGISLAIERGEFVAIVGRSGSGKSTLLNLLGGLDRPSAGDITVDGTRLLGAGDDALAAYRREQVGFVFQFFNLVPSLTAQANVELPMIFARVPRAERARRAGELLTRVGLGARVGHHPAEMSGGEQQRVAIARALVMEPDLLLADEPTGNLDSRTAGDVMELLRRLNQDHRHTIVLITHERDLARAYASRMVELCDGRVATDTRFERSPAAADAAAVGASAAPSPAPAPAGAPPTPENPR